MLATLASQIPILAPASPPLGSGFFDLTPFDQKTGHSSLHVYQDPQKLILWSGEIRHLNLNKSLKCQSGLLSNLSLF